MPARRALFACCLLALLAIPPAAAEDATYPERGITMVVPFPAGGRADISARLLAMRLHAALNVAVTVQNRPGAGGAIGTRAVLDAKADGYTLLFTSSALVSAQYNVEKAPRAADFHPLGLIDVTYPVIVARKGLHFSLKNPAAAGKGLTMGTIPGASTQAAVDGFLSLARLDAARIPFKGEADSVAALLGGHIDLAAAGWQTVQAHVKAGQLDAIGIAGPSRLSDFSSVPTLREQGIDLVLDSFQGLFAAREVPRAVAGRLEDALARVMTDEAMLRDMRSAGVMPRWLGSADARRLIERQDVQYRELAGR